MGKSRRNFLNSSFVVVNGYEITFKNTNLLDLSILKFGAITSASWILLIVE